MEEEDKSAHELVEEVRIEKSIDNNPDKIDFSKIGDKIKKNPWILISAILGIAVLVLLYLNFSGGITGNVVSETEAGQNVIDFGEAQGVNLEVVSIVDKESFYEVGILVNGEESGVYVTKDGGYMIQPMAPLTGNAVSDTPNQQPLVDVVKSDKPVLEAIVTPYCPYGLQYMKGLLPVYELMKDKADISILSLGVTHMQNEELETQRQICINQEYSKDIMFNYIKELIYDKNTEVCYAEYHDNNGEYAKDVAYFDECMAPTISSVMKKLNIDESVINNCIQKDGEKLYDDAVNYARSKGASGSPSPFINDVKLSAGRSPEAIKTALCSAFNNAPEECSTILSEETPAPGITTGTSSSGSTAQC